MRQSADLLETIANGLTKSPDDRPRVQWLMDELTWELRGLRREMKSDDWKSFVAVCRSHRLRDLVHSDPFTNWSFSRPRGYPGDASLLDFIYGESEVSEHVQSASVLGQSIFARNRNVPSCRAVRYRKSLLAERLKSLGGGVKFYPWRAGISVSCAVFRGRTLR